MRSPSRVISGFKNLTELTYLRLYKTQVSDDGLAHLKKLKNITTLHLQFTRITSSGLAHISHMQQLTHLYLMKTSVDAAAIVHLAKLEKLKHLYLDSNKFTEEDRGQLKRKLPKRCYIYYWRWSRRSVGRRIDGCGCHVTASTPSRARRGCEMVVRPPRVIGHEVVADDLVTLCYVVR